ncbi:hypothetical protein AbraIFM66950_002732 [Aspergillus brasiliensis]|nr:hypothetical protein AbraIFM66950_002732 [Aspergillus brasiliensis]
MFQLSNFWTDSSNQVRAESPPFCAQPLTVDNNSNALLSLLPASYRTASDNLVASSRDLLTCIEKELDLERLDKIYSRLWVAGRPMPPRPLHYQLLLSREIFVTERMDMHLVWTTGRMFLKPIPRFLLLPQFWTDYLSCAPGCRCPKEVNSPGVNQACDRRRLWKRALGFLFSYAALIMHESDFLIAKEKHLLPDELQWPDWRTIVDQLDTGRIYSKIDRRFLYGELRLSRLNKIYFFSQSSLRGYMARWHQYEGLFQDNFAWLASATVYIAVVLSSMQLGLATDALQHNNAFQSASYGFTVFSILGPLIAIALVLAVFCYIFASNWVATVVYKRKRFSEMKALSGVEA